MAEPDLTYRYSWKALAGSLALGILAGLVLLAAGIMSTIWPIAFLAPLPPLFALGRGLLLRAGDVYHVHPDRLEMERGILSRRIDNLELFRVRDLGVRQGFLGRLLNYGQVYLHSTDASTPDIVMPAVDRPREFYQALRERITASRAQRQTMIVEEETHQLEG